MENDEKLFKITFFLRAFFLEMYDAKTGITLKKYNILLFHFLFMFSLTRKNYFFIPKV